MSFIETFQWDISKTEARLFVNKKPKSIQVRLLNDVPIDNVIGSRQLTCHFGQFKVSFVST